MNIVEKKLIQLAYKCIHRKKYEYAEIIIKRLLRVNPNDPQILREIGIIFAASSDYRRALKFINKSFELKKSVETLQILADMNGKCENHAEAAVQYEELTKYIDSEEVYSNCVLAYQNLDLYKEAVRIAKLAIEKFGSAYSYSILCHMYIACGMGKEAEEYCKILEAKYPNSPTTFNALAFLNEAVYNDYATAKKYFIKAAKSGMTEAYYNLGSCCKNNEDFVNAEKYLKKLIALKPNSAMDYNYTLGSVYMAQRKLRLGYKYYQKRHSAKQTKERYKHKIWDGKDYPDKVLYVAAEQGMGDNIQFIRYLPYAAKKFKKIVYGASPKLYELFKNSFNTKETSNIEIVRLGAPIRFHKVALIMDLPYILHMNFYNIPAKRKYLTCNKEKTAYFKTKYFNNDKLKVGLCWRAKGEGLRDAIYRTIDAPYYFKPLFDISNIQYYSLQLGDFFNMCEKYPQIIDLSTELKTFDDTAAVMKNLDIMITVDTAVAHLAGALGLKTYLLLCHAPDWRWFENTSKTEWYPSIKIIRQQDRRTWDDVSDTLYKKISKDAKNFSRHHKS